MNDSFLSASGDVFNFSIKKLPFLYVILSAHIFYVMLINPNGRGRN